MYVHCFFGFELFYIICQHNGNSMGTYAVYSLKKKKMNHILNQQL